MKSILVTNNDCVKFTAHAICSFIDSIGYASGPIRRCLFIGYIIKLFNVFRLSGDYESLTAGNAKDALVDMTGGVGERITLAEYKTEDQRKDLFRILRHSKEDHSLMSASIQVCATWGGKGCFVCLVFLG